MSDNELVKLIRWYDLWGFFKVNNSRSEEKLLTVTLVVFCTVSDIIALQCPKIMGFTQFIGTITPPHIPANLCAESCTLDWGYNSSGSILIHV